MVKDPVCGMSVDPAVAEFSSYYNEHDYYFCSKKCEEKFEADPSSYVKHLGAFARFLRWISKGNEKAYHGNPPNCCGH